MSKYFMPSSKAALKIKENWSLKDRVVLVMETWEVVLVRASFTWKLEGWFW